MASAANNPGGGTGGSSWQARQPSPKPEGQKQLLRSHVPPPLPMPTTHYVYSPFSATQALRQDGTSARLLGTSWENKQKFTVVRHGQSPQPLAGIHPATVIYIVCHCSAGSDVVSDNNGNTLNAAQLAKRMDDDGLAKNHQVLKLWACSGGKDDPVFGPSFASKLKQALVARLYTPTLYAYTATLWSLTTLPDVERSKPNPPVYDPAFGAQNPPVRDNRPGKWATEKNDSQDGVNAYGAAVAANPSGKYTNMASMKTVNGLVVKMPELNVLVPASSKRVLIP